MRYVLFSGKCQILLQSSLALCSYIVFSIELLEADMAPLRNLYIYKFNQFILLLECPAEFVLVAVTCLQVDYGFCIWRDVYLSK